MEWKRFIDKALGKDFDAPQYDPKKGRDKLVKAIDAAASQHTEGKTRVPNRSWNTGANNAIRFVPKLNGNDILLDDGHAVYMPAEHFQTFLSELKASVQAGELDKEIKAALDGDKPVKSASSVTSPRKRSTSSGEPHPAEARGDFASLSSADKQAVKARYRAGKNPDNSLIAEVGHKPDAPIASARV